jgi:hypothetical protein
VSSIFINPFWRETNEEELSIINRDSDGSDESSGKTPEEASHEIVSAKLTLDINKQHAQNNTITIDSLDI